MQYDDAQDALEDDGLENAHDEVRNVAGRTRPRPGESIRRAAYSRVTRNRKALPTTLTDDNAIAAAAMIGDSRIPKLG